MEYREKVFISFSILKSGGKGFQRGFQSPNINKEKISPTEKTWDYIDAKGWKFDFQASGSSLPL